MEKNIINYYTQATETPWGKLFYDCVFKQLKIASGLKILDFGSGFGITASYYAEKNEVIAIEPNPDMLALSNEARKYQQLLGNEEVLDRFCKNSFDLIICHNVLEYTNLEQKEEIISKLLYLLKKGGQLSLIKHNQIGAIVQEAVLMDDPKKALNWFEKMADYNLKKSYFGTVNYYDRNQIEEWCRHSNAVIKKCLGIRSMYSLSQNNEMKGTDDWYTYMQELELAVAEESPFMDMAFFHHFIIQKQ